MTSPDREQAASYDPTREPWQGAEAEDADTPKNAQPDAQDGEIVGVPGEDSREPSMPHGSSGQDAGSMD